MDELEKLWNKYLEVFPNNKKTLSILITATGQKRAIEILSLAVDRGKEIEFANNDTDSTEVFIEGENI